MNMFPKNVYVRQASYMAAINSCENGGATDTLKDLFRFLSE